MREEIPGTGYYDGYQFRRFSFFTGLRGVTSTGRIDWRFIQPAAETSFGGGRTCDRIMRNRIKGKTYCRIFSTTLTGGKWLHQTFVSLSGPYDIGPDNMHMKHSAFNRQAPKSKDLTTQGLAHNVTLIR